MKVLFTIDGLNSGGTEKSTADILSHFSKDTEVKVIYFFPQFDLVKDYEKAGIPLHFVGLKGKQDLWKGTMKLRKIIKQEKPDLIVSSIMRANLYSRFASILTGVPVVGTFVSDGYGGLRLEEMKGRKNYLVYKFFWWLDKVTSKIPKYFISNGIYIANSNAKALSIPKNKIKVIYRGRNTTLFPEWKPQTDGVFRFVFVGRLMERKGLNELIHAFKTVVQIHKNAELHVCGDGPFRFKLEALLKELQLTDKVVMHGKVSQGWKKLYDANCFVFPSWTEGFSGALVEAMIAGIPIIASDIPQNLEAVNESTSLIFKVTDHNDLAEKMIRMIDEYDVNVEKAKRTRDIAREKYEIKNISAQYENFLKDVLNKRVDKQQLI